MSRWPEAEYSEADVLKDPRWKLHVRSWVGTLGNAEHYMASVERWRYVRIKGLPEGERPHYWSGKEVCEIEYQATAAQARRLSSQDFTVREGDWSTRFFTEEDAIQQAIHTWGRLAQVGEWLEDDFWDVDESHPKVYAGERPDVEPKVTLSNSVTTNLEPPEVRRLIDVRYDGEDVLQ